MLDIYITHYKEPWEVCRKQFLMLDLQRRVDWGEIRVTVINDGGYRLPDDKLKDLGFCWKAKEFRQLDIPHGGISRARNAGIEDATEPWIMFCDCDDCFSNIYALEDIMTVLKSGVEDRFDMLWTKVWEEMENEVVMLIPDYRIFVFCHGKVYRREFLLEQGLRFEESLTFNEDSCFNNVIFARVSNQRIGAIRSYCPVYTWIRRVNSVATSGREDEGTYCNFRRDLIVTEENRLHRPDQYAAMVTRTAYDAYFMSRMNKITPSCKQKILEEFRPWIRERIGEFGRVLPETLDGILAISMDELAEKKEQVTHKDVVRWVHRQAEG